MAVSIPKLTDPIVLVHGLCGFHIPGPLGTLPGLEYFPGLARLLSRAGNEVHTAGLSPTEGVKTRAEQLRKFILTVEPNRKVHLIAHSMGGLDSRYMLSKLDMSDRVLSLTTIATPHRGSSFADWGLKLFGRLFKPFMHWLHLPYQGFYDVRVETCQEFNREVPDVPTVKYFSVAGRCEGAWLSPEYAWSHQIIHEREGENDGLVSVASAQWGESVEVWNGNHMDLIGWPNPQAAMLGYNINRVPHFAGLLRRIRTAVD